MASKKKLLQAAAGAAGGAGLDVDEVFSTYLYEGNGTYSPLTGTNTINNGIDLSGEGGLVWARARDSSTTMRNTLFDTERGVSKVLYSERTDGQGTFSGRGVTSFNSNGFTLTSNLFAENYNGDDCVSWTFRKAPKFFDVVTYTGDGTNGRSVSHNLGTTVGMIILKRTDAAGDDWQVFHRYATNKRLELNNTDAAAATTLWGSGPTSTNFTVDNASFSNASGATYVAYLFAHNNSDGDFGPDGDQDIIKCGSYTGNGSDVGSFVDLGFEPQWILTKNVSLGTEQWHINDIMRGATNNASDARLEPSRSVAEANGVMLDINPTGFTPRTVDDKINGSGSEYIYMAIRRGPLAEPESATDVFAIDTQVNQDPPKFDSGFVVDFEMTRNVSSTADWAVGSRLIQGKQLNTNNENAETNNPANTFDFMDGWNGETSSTNSNVYSWMWKRAPSYFDVVCYDGSGSNRTISHNLGVAPEMMWVKSRSNSGLGWMTYHTGTGATHYMMVNSTAAAVDLDVIWNDTAPTSSVFSVGTGGSVNDSGKTYIAYLFATVAGVSKVGSFSHTNGGGDTNVDCGFSSGARFVLYKQYDSSGSWYVLDSVRGIVAGNDPALLLNSTAAEDSSYDQIDPLSSGFTIPSAGVGTGDYIFYAIA